MSDQPQVRDRLYWARRAAERAAHRGGYMASLLAAYREMRGMDEEQLAVDLGCPPERLPLLGLCRQPEREAPRFAADVQAIAAYAGASAGRLAQLIRAVDTARVFVGRSEAGAEGLLAAARDAGEQPGDAEEPTVAERPDQDEQGSG
jgi:hypothetical protein